MRFPPLLLFLRALIPKRLLDKFQQTVLPGPVSHQEPNKFTAIPLAGYLPAHFSNHFCYIFAQIQPVLCDLTGERLSSTEPEFCVEGVNLLAVYFVFVGGLGQMRNQFQLVHFEMDTETFNVLPGHFIRSRTDFDYSIAWR